MSRIDWTGDAIPDGGALSPLDTRDAIAHTEQVLRAEIERSAVAMRRELAEHERRAAHRGAERAAGAAAELAEIRTALSALAGVPATLAAIRADVDALRADVGALDGRAGALERDAEREAWREEGRREARGVVTGVGPSPLVVAAAPAPAAQAWYERWTPTQWLILAALASTAATGQAIPWADLLRTAAAPVPVPAPRPVPVPPAPEVLP